MTTTKKNAEMRHKNKQVKTLVSLPIQRSRYVDIFLEMEPVAMGTVADSVTNTINNTIKPMISIRKIEIDRQNYQRTIVSRLLQK
jgi:hypothetical protein